MSESEFISIETTIDAPIQKVWDSYTLPEHITKWNFADPSWECPIAENDLRVGGLFKSRMQAKDGSAKFDFEGKYTEVQDKELIEYILGDGREVVIYFEELDENTTHLTIDFDPETQNSIEMQQAGWQSILDNFKKYVESDS